MRTEPRPPLTKRLRPRHWIALDYVIAGMLAIILSFVYLRGLVHTFPAAGWVPRVWVALALAVLTCAPVALRRRHTIPALAGVLAISLVTAFIAPTNVPPAFFAVALVLYVVAVTLPRKVSVAGLAIVLVVLTAESLAIGGMTSGSGSFIPIDLFVIIVWTIGYAVGQRRAYAARLQEQVASSAVAEERLRIARELHDVVAHSMTVVAVQAGFGQYVFDDQPAQARAALATIQAASREALGEMQHLLGALRQAAPGGADGAGAGPALAPAPGLADLDRLISRTADTGLHVDLRWHGERREIPAGIDMSAYRIVQEALTNVVKHARAASCRVTIAYRDTDLAVEITDDGPAAALGAHPHTDAAAGGNGGTTAHNGTGHGIVGMRERVHLYGGQFSAAPLADRGFRVAALFPVNGGGAR